MANTSIPLSVQQIDPVNPLLIASQFANQKRAGELQSLQIQGQKQANSASAAQARREGLKIIAQDTIAFDTLVQSGDLQAAAMLGQEIKRTMQDFQIPTEEADKLLSLFNRPNELRVASAEARKSVEGVLPQIFDTVSIQGGQAIQQDQRGNVRAQQIAGYQAPAQETFTDVRDAQGNIVGQRNSATNQLSGAPNAMTQQANPLETYIQQLEVQNQQLTNQRLQGQIVTDQQTATRQAQEADLKLQENQQRQTSIQNEAVRAAQLTQKMLGNRGALENATGPISSMLPTLRPETADFEANLKELENLLTLGNLNRMTGVLSESDIRILANAASGLSTEASEPRMIQKLQEIQARLSQNPAVMQALQQGQPQQNSRFRIIGSE